MKKQTKISIAVILIAAAIGIPTIIAVTSNQQEKYIIYLTDKNAPFSKLPMAFYNIMEVIKPTVPVTSVAFDQYIILTSNSTIAKVIGINLTMNNGINTHIFVGININDKSSYDILYYNGQLYHDDHHWYIFVKVSSNILDYVLDSLTPKPTTTRPGV